MSISFAVSVALNSASYRDVRAAIDRAMIAAKGLAVCLRSSTDSRYCGAGRFYGGRVNIRIDALLPSVELRNSFGAGKTHGSALPPLEGHHGDGPGSEQVNRCRLSSVSSGSFVSLYAGWVHCVGPTGRRSTNAALDLTGRQLVTSCSLFKLSAAGSAAARREMIALPRVGGWLKKNAVLTKEAAKLSPTLQPPTWNGRSEPTGHQGARWCNRCNAKTTQRGSPGR
jgi:hypothetical protein